MAKVVRVAGRALWIVLPLLAVGIFLAFPPGTARASYTNPYWSSSSPSPECGCSGCGCARPPEWSPEGVSYRTGEARIGFFLFDTPGMVGRHDFALTWRSMTSGATQFGNGMLFNLERTLEITLGETIVYDRWPSGRIVTWYLDAGTYVTSDCSVHDTLEKNGSGYFEIHGKYKDVWTFDANGMPSTYADRNGNALTFTYSTYQLTGITDDRGKSYTFHHDGSGFVDYITDPTSRTWNFSYSSGNLVGITTPHTPDQTSGITTTISYDGSDRIDAIEDGNENTVYEYAYVTGTEKIDHVTIDGDDPSYAYYTGRTDVTDRLGNLWRYYYSGANITKTCMYVDSEEQYVTNYTYNGDDLITVVYPRGNRLDLTYDGDSNITERRRKTTDTASTSGTDIVESYAYSHNFLTSYTDALGNETTYTRDTPGNLTRIDFPDVTDPSSQSAYKTWTYNGYGQVTAATDEEGTEVDYSYFSSGDYVGLLHTVEVDPSGLDLTTTYAYDSYRNVSSVTDPNGNATTTTWDALRRRTEVDAPYPLSYQTKYKYDGMGNLVQADVQNVDKDGNVSGSNPWFTTTYTYTATNHVATITEEIDASTTRTTTVEYDANENRIRVTKPEGNKEKWVYDERDLVYQHIRGETDEEASTETFAYDDNGNLVTRTDGRSHSTTYTYDLFDRRTRTTNALSHYETTDYDKAGHVTKIERRDSGDTLLERREFAYDERGRLFEVTDLYKDPGTTYDDAVTTIERRKTGQVLVVTNARGKDTTYDFDDAGRMVSVTDAMGNETAWTLDDAGNRTDWSVTEIDGESSVTHQYEATYDVLNRMATRTEIDRLDGEHELDDDLRARQPVEPRVDGERRGEPDALHLRRPGPDDQEGGRALLRRPDRDVHERDRHAVGVRRQ